LTYKWRNVDISMTKPLVRGTLILYSSSRSTAWQTKNKMLSYRRETAL